MSKSELDFYLKNNYSCNISNKDTYSNVKRIIVVGDIHGDLNILLKCLKRAKVINGRYKWCGADTHVVQLGDILDAGGRGTQFNTNPNEEFEIYKFLNNLDLQARQTNGRVHYLIGNHELMNISGDFRYVHKTHLSYTGINTRKKLFKPGSYIANMLACHSYGILKINKWYFCHAGLLPSHVNNRNITTINNIVKDVLRGKKSIDNITQNEYDLIFSKDSFFWNRFYAQNEDKCEILNNTLDLLGEKSGGMVLGHTPHYNITSQCRRKLWFADVGLSKAFGNDMYNKIQVLEIKNNVPKVI